MNESKKQQKGEIIEAPLLNLMEFNELMEEDS